MPELPAIGDDTPGALLEHAVSIKQPVKELAELLSTASDADKAVFNTRIGNTPFGVLGFESFAAGNYEGYPQLLPFLYGSCYAALQISAAVADLESTDEMVVAISRQIIEACADLIRTYEAYADTIYAAHK